MPLSFLNPTVLLYAKFGLQTLRANGVSDAKILSTYTAPDDFDDAAFEEIQLIEQGQIVAPAQAVKAVMRALILASAVAA